MRILLLLILLILSVNQSFTQSKINLYHEFTNKAEQLINKKNYSESLKNATKSLELDLNYANDAFSFFSRYLENIKLSDLSMLQNFENYCYLLAENGISWKDINSFGNRIISLGDPFRTDSLKSKYLIFVPSIRFKDIVVKSKYQQKYLKAKKTLPKMDKHLIKCVKRIDNLDQNVRNSKEKSNFSYYDSLVYIELIKLIKANNGFPRYDEIGEEGYDIIGTCLSHMTAERLVTILPELEKGVQNGIIFIVKDIIYAIDRVAVESGKYIILKNGKYVIVVDASKLYKTYYYSGVSSFYFTYKGGKKYLYPINPNLNLEDINKLRHQFFLPNIDQTIIQYSLEYISPAKFKNTFLQKKIRLNSYL